MNKKLKYPLIILFALFLSVGSASSQSKMDWWREAKFGMFIHWGIYSVPAGKWGTETNYGEWIMNKAKISRKNYSAFAQQFNPTDFDAEDWVKLAKAAGQKYMVITSKHHDGFAMFKSEASNYNVYDAAPFKRDVLAELANACRKYNMKLGFYYSQSQDWYHPGGGSYGEKWDKEQQGSFDQYIDSVSIPQVKEILSKYGDVAIIWWDTPAQMWKKHAEKFLEITKQYPNLIMNSRLGGDVEGDFETPEQFVPATGFPGRDWEVCMTLNDMWGYNAYNKNWKPAQELVEKLVDIVSKGGNFLLNVGPTSKGIIPYESVEILKDMGSWLNENGESIYGTTASPIPYISWCKATRKGQKLYLHIPNSNWQIGKIFKLPLLNKVKKVYALTNNQKEFKFKSQKDGVTIQLCGDTLSNYVSVLAVDFEGEPVEKPNPLAGCEFSVSSSDSLNTIANAFDGNPKTVWKSTKTDSCAIINLELTQSASIQAISIVEPWHSWDGQSQNFRIEYFTANKWVELSSFKTNGTANTFKLKPTNLNQIRVFISNSKTNPQVSEILIFRKE